MDLLNITCWPDAIVEDLDCFCF